MSPITFGHVTDAPAKPAQKSIPGSFATGKGTTKAIIEAFRERNFYTVRELGDKLGQPARQLNKRVSELVKRGVLAKDGEMCGNRIDFQRGPNFPA